MARQLHSHDLYKILARHDVTFFYGVPDSLVSPFSFFLAENATDQHTITANEGNAIGLAIGYHLATGKIPLVYMQNSGLSNALDPLVSLADSQVFATPMLLLVSWRGEPGAHDEPQHIRQGAITVPLLDLLEIPHEVLSDSPQQVAQQIARATTESKTTNKPYALLVKKELFAPYSTPKTVSHTQLSREQAITTIAEFVGAKDILVSGIGKVSRELFEYRETAGQEHDRDVLVVGGMGHASSVALGIAEQAPLRQLYCLDGDGAVRMHMGVLALIGAKQLRNFCHIVFSNGVHDSVGGQQITAPDIPLETIAGACGYSTTYAATGNDELRNILRKTSTSKGPHLIVVKVKPGARKNLGRPTVSPGENKLAVQSFIRSS